MVRKNKDEVQLPFSLWRRSRLFILRHSYEHEGHLVDDGIKSVNWSSGAVMC